jgi:3-oxoacyl-[acyl-carrier-protein] synthase III
MSTSRHPAAILGVGSYAPARVLTNGELSRMVDTTDEWIVTRTGIRERRIAEDGVATSDLAARAGEAALRSAGLKPGDIDAVLVATLTPDLPFPSTACLVQQKLGLPTCMAFDLQAACSGFIYGLEVAQSLVSSGLHRNVLLIGAEKLSSIVDWKDRSTCVLFGDGAGAVVVGPGPARGGGILGVRTGADGSDAELLLVPAGGSRQPASAETVAGRQHFLRMNGREIFKHAVLVMEQAVHEVMAQHGVAPSDIDCVVPHQANFRIIDTLSERLKLPLERFVINVDRYGNTSAASIPLALDEAVREGRIHPGSLVLMVAFGAGLTWGSALLRWTASPPKQERNGTEMA